MEPILIAASFATIIVPRAASPYVAIEGGLLHVKNNDIDELVDFQSIQSPATPMVPPTGIDQEYDDVFAIKYGKGYDFSIIGGFDFGWSRLELEFTRKRTGLRHIVADDNAENFLSSFNAELNRPSQAPDPGAPGLPALALADFDLDGDIRATAVMANTVVDFELTKRLSSYIGYGFGRAWVRALGDNDAGWARQHFYGVRYKVSGHFEIGLKYREFNSGIVKLQQKPLIYGGNPDRITVAEPGGGTFVDRTTNSMLVPELEGAFRPKSVVANLIYNF